MSNLRTVGAATAAVLSLFASTANAQTAYVNSNAPAPAHNSWTELSKIQKAFAHATHIIAKAIISLPPIKVEDKTMRVTANNTMCGITINCADLLPSSYSLANTKSGSIDTSPTRNDPSTFGTVSISGTNSAPTSTPAP